MNDSLKLRSLSGWSILLLGVLLFITSFMPVVLRGGQSPAAGMLGVFGLLAIGVGIALSAARDSRLSKAASRRFCVALMLLVFAAAGGFFDIAVQRTSFFDGLGSLHATLGILFAALLGVATLACIATARGATGTEKKLAGYEKVARLFRLLGLLSLVVGVLLGVLSLSIEATRSFEGMLPVVLLLLPPVLYLPLSKAIMERKRWGRTVGNIIGALALLWIPIGTILGIYILVQLNKSSDTQTNQQ